MKKRNFVNLNINPCKMCMPMGAVLAIKGIENSMVILHGSQGCSTYMRRHMAGHFNEPIDIASSSLNEKGTVYGGEKNLKTGFENVIKQYDPELIGVATTCLAETIGEDIPRFVKEFKEEHNIEDKIIVPIATPGYGGSQFEGYYAALRSLVEWITVESEKSEKVNIIVGGVSSADTRNIKRILKMFNIDYVMLPDISETLDAPYKDTYSKIPEGGTKIEDIRKMSGAKATIEMGLTVDKELSPGEYLNEKYQVPLYKCAIPSGLSNTDEFVKILSIVSGNKIPDELKIERGRLLDAMVDSHKFNGEGRVVIYGEPELSFSIGRFCSENGIKPVLVSTGTKNKYIKEVFGMYFNEESVFIDEIDFETIEDYANKLKVNIAIGNSDGKVLTERLDIPVVRIGFPISDRIGGQRLLITGYNGTLVLLDRITNTIIEKKYGNYRKRMYKKYYEGSDIDVNKKVDSEKVFKEAEKAEIIVGDRLKEKTMSHPCYSGSCHNARMHMPVAPKCNIQCNYCNRKYDCVNESRPGVTSEILSPKEALVKFKNVKSKLNNLTVVGIAGPGDALADFDQTKETIIKIKEESPDITFCISTNGLMLPYYAQDLYELGIEHLTVTVNTIDTKIGAQIYKYINYMGVKLEGEKAAEILLKNQLAGIKMFAKLGGVVKVNIVMIKGVNDMAIEDVVNEVKACGAYMTNIMPLIPAEGSAFEHLPLTSGKELKKTQKKCEEVLKQMYHCKQCRADAIGTLDNDISAEFRSCIKVTKNVEENAVEDNEYKFAVATNSGIYIDRHFGQVDEFHIFKYINDDVEFVETRKIKKYCTGVEECDEEDIKMKNILATIEDCIGVVVQRIGYNPKKALEESGKYIIQSCTEITDSIKSEIKNIKEKAVSKQID